jgi:hypothetical protein
MNTKSKENDMQNLSFFIPCCHIDEKMHHRQFGAANTQKPLWLAGKTDPLYIITIIEI